MVFHGLGIGGFLVYFIPHHQYASQELRLGKRCAEEPRLVQRLPAFTCTHRGGPYAVMLAQDNPARGTGGRSSDRGESLLVDTWLEA